MKNTFNFNKRIANKIRKQVGVMLATGDTYSFVNADYRDYMIPIHDLIYSSIEMGEDFVAARTEALKVELVKKGFTNFPDEDFVYYGGKIIPLINLFASTEDKKVIADKLADEMISAIKDGATCTSEDVVNILLVSAALDDVLLAARTDAMVAKMQQTGMEFDISIGNAAILPDSSIISLHYMYA